MLVNNWNFVYRANPGKESVIARRRSRSARPYTDVVKRNAAVRSHAVVADKRVDSPPVEESRGRPNAFADQNSRVHAFKNPHMQSCSSAPIAKLHDVAFREPQPSRIGWVHEHFWSLFA